jgi:hypothetical protein
VEQLRGVLMAPAYTYTVFDQIYHNNAGASQVTTAVKRRRGRGGDIRHGSETSWGTTGFSVSQVNNLTNATGMLPFIVSVACVNGRFNYSTTSDCFAEAWLKAGTPAAPKGAVAFYGSSTNQSWVPPCVGQREIVDRLAAETYHTIGALYVNGCMKAVDQYPGTGSGSGAEVCQSWHIFGDASLQVFTNTPAAMTVNHDGILPAGQETYAVAVPGVPGALCALYDEAAGTLHGSSHADGAGNAVISLDPPPGEGAALTLPVTAFNRLPFFDAVAVPAGPSVLYDPSYDPLATLEEACGDGDGTVEPGEEWWVTVRLRNAGSEPAAAVVADLAVSAGSVVAAAVLAGNPGAYGTIAPGWSASAQYAFRVDEGAACGSGVTFDLSGIASAERGYPDHPAAFTVPVGIVQAGSEETRTQQGPLAATNGAAQADLGAEGFSLAAADGAVLSYAGGYASNAGAVILFSDDFTGGLVRWTAEGNAAGSSGTAHCSGADDWVAQLTGPTAGITLADPVSTAGYADIRFQWQYKHSHSACSLAVEWFDGAAWSAVAGSPFTGDALWRCDNDAPLPPGAAGKEGIRVRFTLTVGSTSRSTLVDRVRITGTAVSAGSWAANARVSLVGPSDGATVLKPFGAEDGSPYDVTALYAGPGLYRVRLEENGGGTATLTGATLQVVLAPASECDIASCASGIPPEVSAGGGAHPLRVVKDPSCASGLCLYFQRVSGAGYNLYQGEIGAWYSHGAGPVCGMVAEDLGNGTMRHDLAASNGDRYYLVTARGATQEGTAGSPGRDDQCTCP